MSDERLPEGPLTPLPEFTGIDDGPGDDLSERVDELVGELIEERHPCTPHS